MTPRPPLTWIAALAGLAVQAVVLVVVTVYLAHQATLDSSVATNLGDAVFRDLFGPIVFGAFAVVTGLLALLAVAGLLLSVPRGGGRLAGLLIAVGIQVPLVGDVVLTRGGGGGAGAIATLVGAALVLVGVVVPATWRWCRRPRRPVETPVETPAEASG